MIESVLKGMFNKGNWKKGLLKKSDSVVLSYLKNLNKYPPQVDTFKNGLRMNVNELFYAES